MREEGVGGSWEGEEKKKRVIRRLAQISADYLRGFIKRKRRREEVGGGFLFDILLLFGCTTLPRLLLRPPEREGGKTEKRVGLDFRPPRFHGNDEGWYLGFFGFGGF